MIIKNTIALWIVCAEHPTRVVNDLIVNTLEPSVGLHKPFCRAENVIVLFTALSSLSLAGVVVLLLLCSGATATFFRVHLSDPLINSQYRSSQANVGELWRCPLSPVLAESESPGIDFWSSFLSFTIELVLNPSPLNLQHSYVKYWAFWQSYFITGFVEMELNIVFIFVINWQPFVTFDKIHHHFGSAAGFWTLSNVQLIISRLMHTYVCLRTFPHKFHNHSPALIDSCRLAITENHETW